MKKVWSEPKIVVQKFVANEYIAACGDENKVYKFVCDAPEGSLYFYDTDVDENINGDYTGNKGSWIFGGDAKLIEGLAGLGYNPCGATHDASIKDDFYEGFIDYNNNLIHDEGESVIVWRGPNNNNGHATTKLNMNSWQTAKS